MPDTMEQEKQSKTKSTIEGQTILTVHDTQGNNGGTEIRVLKWLIDGKPTQTFLEKRQYRMQNESKLFMKAKGFTKDDLNILVSKWDEIAEAMNK